MCLNWPNLYDFRIYTTTKTYTYILPFLDTFFCKPFNGGFNIFFKFCFLTYLISFIQTINAYLPDRSQIKPVKIDILKFLTNWKQLLTSLAVVLSLQKVYVIFQTIFHLQNRPKVCFFFNCFISVDFGKYFQHINKYPFWRA